MSSFDPAGKPVTDTWLHFAGMAGSGMSALAQFHAFGGGFATGSDRSFDQGERADIRAKLEGLGIVAVPQDGSFLGAGGSGRRCDAVVVSTAVEDKVPDVRAAREAGIPILHRSELLAHYVAAHRTIAVTGTSGKSTVTAMVYSLLRGAGRHPALLTGGAVEELIAEGHIGNAFYPASATDPAATLLVIEADESDGSVVRYHPWLGVVLNLGLDHKEPAEILDMFRIFRAQIQDGFLRGDQPELAELGGPETVFGLDEGPGLRARDLQPTDTGTRFTVEGVPFSLPVPGRHNVANAVAALAACRRAGVPLEEMVEPLAGFRGVSRRFQSVGRRRDVEVIDDFAHNPDKIAASLETAAARTTGRVLAVFQPHGFGPTRFLRDALVAAFAAGLREQDSLWLPEIFFAGGTVERTISSADLVADLADRGVDARFCALREDLPQQLATAASAGDLILVMGARDPSLTAFCGDVLEAL